MSDIHPRMRRASTVLPIYEIVLDHELKRYFTESEWLEERIHEMKNFIGLSDPDDFEFVNVSKDPVTGVLRLRLRHLSGDEDSE